MDIFLKLDSSASSSIHWLNSILIIINLEEGTLLMIISCKKLGAGGLIELIIDCLVVEASKHVVEAPQSTPQERASNYITTARHHGQLQIWTQQICQKCVCENDRQTDICIIIKKTVESRWKDLRTTERHGHSLLPQEPQIVRRTMLR